MDATAPSGDIVFAATLDFISISAQESVELTISVPAAVVGDAIAPAWPAVMLDGIAGTMRVTASGTVTVRLVNATVGALDPASATYGGRILR